MNSNRFVNLRSRRNFRVGVVVAFLLGMGVLAACQTRAQVPRHDDQRMMISSANRK
jgi:allophanate hydrolase subunit 1